MKNLLDNASQAYYEGTPIMSDASFDVLAAHFNYNTVGYNSGGVEHYYPLYSLQKYFDMSEAPSDLHNYIKTPKLDGAAISILYVEGHYSLALSRGDGKVGQDVTENVRCLVPPFIKIKEKGVVQLTGEIVAPSSIPNPRNYAAGALNLKDAKEFKTRDLTFVLYGVQPNPFDFWSEILEVYALKGFNTVLDFDTTNYPIDGLVYRINDMEEYRNLGFTSKHPRGAFAFKIQAKGVETTLLDVVWQVGKSGVVSPVAILEPVLVGDALVSRATLHNIKYINDLNLELDCQVEIIRSGEIIPRVVRRIDNE